MPGSCAFCERPIRCRGWCNAHYKRWRRTGNPLGSVIRPVSKYCPAGHKFTKANTIIGSRGYRKCLACKRYWSKVYARRARAEGRAAQHRPGYWTEYKREVREGIRVPKKRVKPHRTRSLPELLEIEGGTWTVEGLALRLKVKPDTVRRQLARLRNQGLVVRVTDGWRLA